MTYTDNTQNYKSKCCKEPVTTRGSVTKHWQCVGCGEATDVVTVGDEYKEIRLDKDGKDDDIVISLEKGLVHLERMNDQCWWLGVEDGAKTYHFDFLIENGELNVYHRGDKLKIIKRRSK